jgi:hypothetical protein
VSDDKPSDREELFICACDLLADALPLAFDRLRGGVSLRDQESFWGAYQRLNEAIETLEPDYTDMLAEYVDGDGVVITASLRDLAAQIRLRQNP